ncbi:metalloregulator ArsR/SmtB family transcription factor [Chelatococcus daeguensis]|uniref:ArsR family transcriptional regulator n=2 Tax=Chelatococcus TaxID=28209 RepID=A0AAC9P0R0_9HYPH|nr:MULTISPECIES: metalloregulator ArsR/SmtB family transcription factor [Chelatococcus]APF39380.1 ArsR family transcriptional regulator [Chelatococcus daeguensis]KZE29268.1 ArsR family transcriptional regulator [Chelatococcus daeguensis]MBM3083995.1 metalloregulator ArsR/SmtB family transcription factor [Chelatococcus daeguensis]CUA87172.1 Predicted transcriptional regulator [Chelatococcus sambhunathii]
MSDFKRKFLTLFASESGETIRALASPARVRALKLLREHGALNVNEISEALDLPQSTVATHIQVLERAGLLETETRKASKGQQKVCSVRYDEIIIRLDDQDALAGKDYVEVAMPIGLYTGCQVTAPCGLCSTDSVLGVLDVPDFFLDPQRMNASLVWFSRGYLEYKFPNNGKVLGAEIDRLEFIMELSSEVPGTSLDWPSEISLWVNDVKVGSWISPGDFGDKRGVYTPQWWKLEGSQYGKLVTWQINRNGTSVNDVQISSVSLDQLGLDMHHGIRMRIGIDDNARHPGGLNIFGRGFGNHDQDIIMRLRLKPPAEAGA